LTAAKRCNIAAHGASRGYAVNGQAPEGAKKMSHTCGNVLLHVIFSTHQRRPLIKPEFRADLFAYLGGIIREMKG